MATLQELRAKRATTQQSQNPYAVLASLVPQESFEKAPKIADTSAIKTAERLAFAAVGENPAAKTGILKKMGYREDQILSPDMSPTGDWAIHDPKTEIVYPVDVKGKAELGDITEMLPGAAKALGMIGGKALGAAGGGFIGSIAGPGGTLAGGYTGGLVGGGVGSAAVHSLMQKAVQKIYEGKEADLTEEERKALGGVNVGEAGKEALMGSVASALPGSGTAIWGALKREPIKEVGKKYMAQNIGKQLASEAIKPRPKGSVSVAQTLAPKDVPTDIAEAAIKGDYKFAGKTVIPHQYEKQITPAYESAAKKLVGIFDEAQGQVSNVYKKLGVTDKTKIDIKGIKPAIKEARSMLGKLSDILDPEQKKVAVNLDKTLKALGNKKTISFGRTKQLTNNIYSILDKADDLGHSSTATASLRKAGAALTQAKNSIPEIANAGQQYKQYFGVVDGIRDTLKLSGKLKDENLKTALVGKLHKLATANPENEVKRNTLRSIQRLIDADPNLKGLSFMPELNAAHLFSTLAKKEFIPPTGFSGTLPGMVSAAAKVTKAPSMTLRSINLLRRLGMIRPDAADATISQNLNWPVLAKILSYGKILKTPTNMSAPYQIGIRSLVNEATQRATQKRVKPVRVSPNLGKLTA